jgi:hypothetical protein
MIPSNGIDIRQPSQNGCFLLRLVLFVAQVLHDHRIQGIVNCCEIHGWLCGHNPNGSQQEASSRQPLQISDRHLVTRHYGGYRSAYFPRWSGAETPTTDFVSHFVILEADQDIATKGRSLSSAAFRQCPNHGCCC